MPYVCNGASEVQAYTSIKLLVPAISLSIFVDASHLSHTRMQASRFIVETIVATHRMSQMGCLGEQSDERPQE
jgi:hypothetical protein